MIKELKSKYVETAEAKGISKKQIIFKHAFKNAIIPVITVMSIQIGAMVVGSVLVENVFALPGLGSLLINAINTSDYPIVQSVMLGIVYVPMLSRLTRSLTLMEKNKTYVESARSIGFSDTRIIFRHILPNCIPTIIAQLTLDIGYAILDLAAMSFLGLGVQPPTSDWGAMLEEGRQYIQSNPALVFAPGLAIIITVVTFNVLSDNIQMYLDPTQRKLPPFKKLKKMAGGLVEE